MELHHTSYSDVTCHMGSHTVLPATWHKWIHPMLLDLPVLDLPITEGWKA